MRLFGKIRHIELPFVMGSKGDQKDTVAIIVLDHAYVTSLENGEPPVKGENINALISKEQPEDRDGTDERVG